MLTGGHLVWTGRTLQRLCSCLSVTSIMTCIVKTTLDDVDFSSFVLKLLKYSTWKLGVVAWDDTHVGLPRLLMSIPRHVCRVAVHPMEFGAFLKSFFCSTSALLSLWEDKNEKQFEMKILVKLWMISIYWFLCPMCRTVSRFWDCAINTHLGYAGFCLNMLSLYLYEA